MQLTARLLSRVNREDGGVALAAVVGLIALTAVVALTISTVTVSALEYSTMTRASVQSVTAAEAGIDVAEVGLRTAGGCATAGGHFERDTAPVFDAQVSYRTTGDWVDGCPSPTALEVRVISTGFADAPAVGDVSAGDETTMEAVFNYIPASGGITASGGAIHTSGTNGLNNLTVTAATSESGTTTRTAVRVRSGSFTCQGGRTIQGDLIVENGSVQLNGCIVLGSIQASGSVSVNSGTNRVEGDVLASGLGGLFDGKYAAQVGLSSTILGDILTNGPVYIDGRVEGSITAAGFLTGISTITPSAKILGSLSLAGLLTTWVTPCGGNWSITGYVCGLLTSGIVGGTIKYLALGLVGPPKPAASAWAGYSYDVSDWTDAGFTEMVWQGSCTVDNYPANRSFIASVMAQSGPVVVNAKGCSTLLFSNSAVLALTVKSDVAFIAPKISVERVTIDAVSAGTRVWFIVPGLTQLSAAACVSVSIKIDNNTTVKANVSALIYSPGCAEVDATTWRGQIYSSFLTIGSSLSLEFVPLGLPGVSLDGGVTSETSSPASLGSRTSLRELTE